MPLSMTPTVGSSIVASAMVSQTWFVNADDWGLVVLLPNDASRSLILPTGGLPHMMWHVLQDDTTGAPGLNAVPVWAKTGTSEQPGTVASATLKGLGLNGWFRASAPQVVPFGMDWVYQAHLPGVSQIGLILFVNDALSLAKDSLISVTLAASAT